MIRLKWTDLVSDSEKESCVVVLVTLASRNDPLTPFSGLKLCLMYPIMRMSSIKGCLTSETTMVSSNLSLSQQISLPRAHYGICVL